MSDCIRFGTIGGLSIDQFKADLVGRGVSSWDENVHTLVLVSGGCVDLGDVFMSCGKAEKHISLLTWTSWGWVG